MGGLLVGGTQSVHGLDDDRKADDEGTPRAQAVTLGRDCSPVHLDQPLHQREADTQAPRLRLPALGEHIEDARQHLGWDADAGVPHRHDGFVSSSLPDQPDAAAPRGVLGGVVQEIRHRLGQPRQVGVEADRVLRNGDNEFLAAALEQRAAGLDRGPQHRRELHAFLAELEPVAGDPRDVHQVVDEPRHLPHLAVDRVQRPLRLWPECLLEMQDLNGVANRGQRIPQLVRQDRQEFVLRAVSLRQDVLGMLAGGDVHEHVHRAEHLAGLVADRVGMSQHGAALAVRTLDDDLVTVVFLPGLQGQRHPALVVRQRRSVRREEPERAAEAVRGVVQLRRAPPELERVVVEERDEPVRVAGVGARRERLEEAVKLRMASREGCFGPLSAIGRCIALHGDIACGATRVPARARASALSPWKTLMAPLR